MVSSLADTPNRFRWDPDQKHDPVEDMRNAIRRMMGFDQLAAARANFAYQERMRARARGHLRRMGKPIPESLREGGASR